MIVIKESKPTEVNAEENFAIYAEAFGKNIKIKYLYWRDNLTRQIEQYIVIFFLFCVCTWIKNLTMNKKILFNILCLVLLAVAVNGAIPQEKLPRHLAKPKANSQGRIFLIILNYFDGTRWPDFGSKKITFLMK